MLRNFIILTFTALILAGCLPSSPNGGKRKNSQKQTLDPDITNTPDYTSSDLLYWYSDKRYNNTITINQDSLNKIYIQGKNINSFLSSLDASNAYNYSQIFCLVGQYSNPYSRDQLRVRAVPMTTNTGGVIERFLRLDLSEKATNQTTCLGDIDSLEQKNISSIVSVNNKLYVGTDQGLYISNDGGLTFDNQTTVDGLGSNQVNAIFVTNLGTIYVATENGLSYSFNNGTSFATWSLSDGLGSNAVKDVHVSLAGTIFAATTNGLSFKKTTDTSFSNRTTGNQLPANSINSVVVNTSGIVFAGTNQGLAYSTDASIASFVTKTTTHGLGSNVINDIFIAGSNVYVATSNGLSLSTNSGSSFINRTTLNGLASNQINAVSASGNNIYAATSNGLAISLNSGASFTNKTTLQGLRSNSIIDVTSNGTQIYGATDQGFFYSNDLAGSTFGALNATSSAYDLLDLCPSCSTILTSSKINIFYSKAGRISDSTKVAMTAVSLDELSLKIDTTNSTTNNPLLCTLDGCQSKGYDCCLQGQCVHDGLLKPSAIYHSDYTQAIADTLLNPKNFTRWPNIYYVCGSTPPNPTPTPTVTPDAQATANALFEQHKREYSCLEGGKLDPPSYTNCTPNQDYASWDLIRRNVWARCGCVADMATPGPDDPRPFCPDIGLKAVKDFNENITAIICDIPQPSLEPTPFQQLKQILLNRSVPHRFYAGTEGLNRYNKTVKKGDPVDDLATLQGSSSAPSVEGTPFLYLDKSTKTAPIDGPYSMNAILGQMSLLLDEALPAQVVNVEDDQVYIISALQGAYYSSCSGCSKDSWFDTFTAFPVTYDGAGLRSIGHSTQRDALDNNLSFGNYEDTIFGRACFIPPTMIPFSHKKNTNLQTQRLNRLQTQAAFFVNGYKRDWFGFNKGAVIGSFDGVSWFAIGTGRRVQATSNKLYLAINAPFGDIADYSSTTVQIIVDNGGNSVSSFDYDPALIVDNPMQNKGATCQSYHQCAKDTDCITRLGWEYVCGDVSKIKTTWPVFNEKSIESVNTQYDDLNIMNILQGEFPTGSMKRCVYRGAGALCKANYSTITNSENRKLLTCAPNFYCATIQSGEFNDRVARELATIGYSNIQLGMEADVLGRPLSYVNASEDLTDAIRDNISESTKNYSSDSDDFGLCRPGKAINSASGQTINQLTQHQSKDAAGRTDYINQIASCNSSSISSYLGNDRVSTCPLIDETTGNYIQLTTNFSVTNYIGLHQQNSCQVESQHNTSGDFESTFKFIEAAIISNVVSLTPDRPTIVKDACLRRAGSVCHTDLDCTPNKLHENFAQDGYPKELFGGTTAERQYWQESLVCGQALPKPDLYATNYYSYDMGLNRCCRAIGENLTMFTSFDSINLFNESFKDIMRDNTALNTASLPKDNPRATGRYSRFTVAYPLGTPSTSAPYAEVPRIEQNTTPKQFQWKTINDTGKKTCCGGTFIRLFDDRTHNWALSYKKLEFDATKLRCLNYQNTLAFLDNDDPVAHNIRQLNYDQDYPNLCKHPHYGDPEKNGGCVQIGIDASDEYTITPPSEISIPADYRGAAPNTAKLDTSPTQSVQTYGSSAAANIPVLHPRASYMPVVFKQNYPTGEAVDPNGPFYYVASRLNIPGSSFYLPIYIGGVTNITAVRLKYYNDSDKLLATDTPAWYNGCYGGTQPYNGNAGAMPDNSWCVVNVASYGDIFHLRANPNRTFGLDENNEAIRWAYAGIVIEYYYINGNSYIYGTGVNPLLSGLSAGNDLYYLTKLGRLELNGIPQIFYEPLYCNSDRSKIVEGMFNNANTRTEFQSISFVYDRLVNRGSSAQKSLAQIYDPTATGIDQSLAAFTGAARSERITFSNQLATPPIFSPHEFTCCQKLNTITTDPLRCCSGFAEEVETQTGDRIKTCKLPTRTDLHVYFNRFVSSEGSGDDITETAKLTDDDFIPETGEPKLRQSTDDKIRSLGLLYCASGVVTKGGAFGNFTAEPSTGSVSNFQGVSSDVELGKYYSIVDNLDNITDSNSDQFAGSVPFTNGWKWNHHWYCK